jgi:hypothetical protein
VTPACPQAAADTAADLLVVGCGLRAAGLLTSTPALLARDTCVIDAANELAVGSFRRYDIESNSSGTDFFGWIDPAGEFGPLLRQEPVRRLRAVPGAFHLGLLADALACTGRWIADRVAPHRLILGETVTGIALSRGEPPRVRTSAGRELRAATVVLAGGIRERLLPELARWRGRTLPSHELISPVGRDRCVWLRAHRGPLCIAGGSHSAFSVLGRILAGGGEPAGEITLITRSPVRIYYRSWAEYRAAGHPQAEAVPDPVGSVCQESGNVHRYSGLRNTSKALFHAVTRGQVPRVQLQVIPDAAQRARYFDQADVLVGAAGYQSNLPPITADGQAVGGIDARGLVRSDSRGRVIVGGSAAESLFVMGMDPYPYADNSVNPTNQYARRGHHILSHLAERQREGTASR